MPLTATTATNLTETAAPDSARWNTPSTALEETRLLLISALRPAAMELTSASMNAKTQTKGMAMAAVALAK